MNTQRNRNRPYAPEKHTALYLRLSRDDEFQGDSNSIKNQRMLLERYAAGNGFVNIKEYVDDGYTGTNFERPGFKAMVADIERGIIGTVIVKDMSRFGRNYLEVGFYTEVMFPNNDVRFIAVGNGVDSANQTDSDFTPFLNIINEWYAKDTSKKIRAVNKSRMERGERTNDAHPYGYDLVDKKLIVNVETAPVVRKIFKLCIEGYGPVQIANILASEKILTPAAYRFTKYGNYACATFADVVPYAWNSQTVIVILADRTYLGDTVLHKSYTRSFKDKRRLDVPVEERYVFEHTHEPIVTEDEFRMVQEIRRSKQRRCRSGEKSIFAGLLYCADCGRAMYNHNQIKRGKPYSDFVCGNYRHKAHACTPHRISVAALEQIVSEQLRGMMAFANTNEKKFVELLQKTDARKRKTDTEQKRKALSKAETRISELDRLMQRIYEDSVSGKITEERFMILSQTYEQEQHDLKETAKALQAELSQSAEQEENLSRFLSVVHRHTEFTELTSELLREFIEKICVHQPETAEGVRTQKVDIYYNFIGLMDISA